MARPTQQIVIDRDGTLLKAAANGDHKAFESLCVVTLPRLLRLARAHCYQFRIPADLAHDFVQDTILRAITWLRDHKDAKVHGGWLRRILLNMIRNWLRREKGSRIVDDPHIAERVDLKVPQGGEDHDVAPVFLAYRKLSEQDQLVLQLVLLDESSPRVVARRLGISTWAAYKRYERALARLRIAMRTSANQGLEERSVGRDVDQAKKLPRRRAIRQVEEPCLKPHSIT